MLYKYSIFIFIYFRHWISEVPIKILEPNLFLSFLKHHNTIQTVHLSLCHLKMKTIKRGVMEHYAHQCKLCINQNSYYKIIVFRYLLDFFLHFKHTCRQRNLLEQYAEKTFFINEEQISSFSVAFWKWIKYKFTALIRQWNKKHHKLAFWKRNDKHLVSEHHQM